MSSIFLSVVSPKFHPKVLPTPNSIQYFVLIVSIHPQDSVNNLLITHFFLVYWDSDFFQDMKNDQMEATITYGIIIYEKEILKNNNKILNI